MSNYTYQARDSVTGVVYSWSSPSTDTAGDHYPGPNSPMDVIQTGKPVSDGGIFLNDIQVSEILTDESITATIVDGVATLSTGDTSAAGAALLASAAIRRSAAVPFVTTRTTTANPAANPATWTLNDSFSFAGGQTDHLGGTTGILMTVVNTINYNYRIRGDLTGITVGDEWEFSGYVKPGTSHFVNFILSFGTVEFDLVKQQTVGDLIGALQYTQDYISSSIVAAGNGWFKVTIRYIARGDGAAYCNVGLGKIANGDLTYVPSGESIYLEPNWTCTRVNVASQQDLGTAGSTIAQATAASSPCYESAGWDTIGAGAIRWTGMAQTISDGALPGALSGAAQPWTLQWLCDPWVAPTSDATMVSATGATAAVSIKLLTTGKLRVSRTNDAGVTVTADTVAPLKLLTQVIGVRYNGSTFSVFSDGIEVPVTPHAASTGQATLTSGAWGGQYLRLLDADALVWSALLTDAQILVAARALGRAWDYDVDEPWTAILSVGQSNRVYGSSVVNDFSGRQRFHGARHWYGGSNKCTSIEPFYSIVGSGGPTARSSLLGPDLQMVKNLVAAGKRKIVVLHYTIGGTALYSMIPSWQGTPNVFYTNMVASFNTALALLPANTEIKALAFTGYEQDTDSDAGTAAAGTNLALLRSSLMASLAIDELEVVANLLHTDYCTHVAVVRGVQVNAAVIAACTPGSHLHCFDPSSYEISQVDYTHFTTRGRNSIGAANAAILQPFV